MAGPVAPRAAEMFLAMARWTRATSPGHAAPLLSNFRLGATRGIAKVRSNGKMTNFPDAISVLSAMITPAVLISACGSLILATSDRLSKAVMRTREISSALIPRAADQRSDDREEERRMLFTQLDFVTTRSRLLQRALSRLYAALGFFVGTSVAIGLVAITTPRFALVPITLGLCGAGLLLYAAFLLIKESRFALAAVNEEMDFMWKRGKEYGPPDLVEQGIKKARWFGGVK